jgi:hypothetical protein
MNRLFKIGVFEKNKKMFDCFFDWIRMIDSVLHAR